MVEIKNKQIQLGKQPVSINRWMGREDMVYTQWNIT